MNNIHEIVKTDHSNKSCGKCVNFTNQSVSFIVIIQKFNAQIIYHELNKSV